jgi:hypothetical protein
MSFASIKRAQLLLQASLTQVRSAGRKCVDVGYSVNIEKQDSAATTTTKLDSETYQGEI